MYFFNHFFSTAYHNLTVEEYDVNGKTKEKKYESRKKNCRHHDGDFLLSRIFFYYFIVEGGVHLNIDSRCAN